jgi:peptidyl-prolyl cis-trans isomerase-like protein 2
LPRKLISLPHPQHTLRPSPRSLPPLPPPTPPRPTPAPQDPLSTQGRTLQDFDHVKKELTIEEAQEGGVEGSVIRNTNPGLQSVLSALGSEEAAAAFKAGGGGRRAEATRALAEAKVAAQKQREQGAAAGGGGGAGAKAGPAAQAQAQAQPGGDWRLRAPEKRHEHSFKPGAVTWDTDDYIAAGPEKKRKGGAGGQEAEAPGGKGAAAAAATAGGGKPSPQQWWEEHYKVRGPRCVPSAARVLQPARWPADPAALCPQLVP